MSVARRFPSGCVASPHHLASSAGLAVLASGGNALDAAVATNLTLGVVTPYMCGFGGDLFAIVWDGELHAYNGSGRAPAAATLDAVRAAAGDGRAMPETGPLSVTVPGAVEAWFKLLARFGTRSFEQLARTPLRYASDGFPIDGGLRAYFASMADRYSPGWGTAWREVYTRADPEAPFRQTDLARTIATLCEDGPDAYYRGPIGQALAETLRSHGALMSAEDLADHTGEWVTTVSSGYRDIEIHQMPPNSQGVVALEALNVAAGLDLGPPESADRHHLLIESTKAALADRDAYLTDPAHMDVDATLLASEGWAAERRSSIDPRHASSPVAGRAAVGGTAYMCAADGDGMIVSLIQSNYMGFGSGVNVGGWGINLQNRGAYFSLDPGHANVVAPRKRTLHTLMPAMALRDGRPWLAFGTMGGDGQAQTQVQFLTRVIDDGRDIQDAIDAPRWVVSPGDWSVGAESRFDEGLLRDLTARGHRVDRVAPFDPQLGHAHAIEVTPAGYAAASDRRAPGAALGL